MHKKKFKFAYIALIIFFVVIGVAELFTQPRNSDVVGNAFQSKEKSCGNRILDAGEECDSGTIRGYSRIVFNCSDGKSYSTTGGCYYSNYLIEYAKNTCRSKNNSTKSLVSYKLDGDCPIKNPIYCFQQSTSFVNKYSFIKCNYNNCTLDFSLCTEKGMCGNGVLEPGEKCDGKTPILCKTLLPNSSNPSAALGCTSNCDFNTSICFMNPSKCGNKIVELGESCDDGNNISGDGCNSRCQFDCINDSECGIENCPMNFTIQKKCINHKCQKERNCSFETFCNDSDGGRSLYNVGTIDYRYTFNGTYKNILLPDICVRSDNPLFNVTNYPNYTEYAVNNCSGYGCYLVEYGCFKGDWNGYKNVDQGWINQTTCIDSPGLGCNNGACVNKSASICGNHIIESGEECDGELTYDQAYHAMACRNKQLDQRYCTNPLSDEFPPDYQMYVDATILQCNDKCMLESECTGSCCGNGKVDKYEACDESAGFNSKCREYGYNIDGMVRCDDCNLNFEECINDGPVCGDGILGPGEICDGYQEYFCEDIHAPGAVPDAACINCTIVTYHDCTPSIVCDNLEVIRKMCNSEFAYLSGYGYGNTYSCGKYCKKIPDWRYLADAPDVMYDNHGIFVAQCGGMPVQGNQSEPDACSIECDPQDLCQ